MYIKGTKGILEIHILVTLVLLTEAEFSCALYDMTSVNLTTRFIIMTNNTNVIVLLHLMVKRTVKTKQLRT